MAEKVYVPNVELEDAKILPGVFKNFSGEKRGFNAKGNRNFNVVIPEDMAEEMEKSGWNVKWTKPYNDDPAEPYIKVNINYDSNYPPKVYRVKNGRKVPLTENNIDELDHDIIISADLVIHPYVRTLEDGNVGISGYLNVGYFIVRTRSRIEEKYEDYEE